MPAPVLPAVGLGICKALGIAAATAAAGKLAGGIGDKISENKDRKQEIEDLERTSLGSVTSDPGFAEQLAQIKKKRALPGISLSNQGRRIFS